jgi:energy-coupling factor transporter ATP-binding protein EcfA2
LKNPIVLVHKGGDKVATKQKIAEYPHEEYFKNFIFMKNGDIWVSYFLDRVYFPLNDPSFFIPYVNDGKYLFEHDEYEYQIVNLPTTYSLHDHFSITKNDLVKGELSEIGKYYYDEAEMILDRDMQLTKYTTLLLVKLTTVPIPATPLEIMNMFRTTLVRKATEVATGRPAATQVAPDVYVRNEENLYQDMLNAKRIRRATVQENKKAMYYFFHRNTPYLPSDFSNPEINEGIVTPHKKGYVTVEQLDRTHYLAFLPIIEMPSSLLGSGFVHEVQSSCYFPIETQIRLKFGNKESDITHVRRMFKRIKYQINDSDLADAELDDDEVVLEGDIRLKQLNIDLKREQRRLVEMSMYFVIGAPNEEELEHRINHLQEVVKGTDYKIYRPQTDQLTLFYQSLLGTKYTFTDYSLKVTTGYVVDLGLDLYRTIGNEFGLPLGRGISRKNFRDKEEALLYSSQLVWYAPHLAKKNIEGATHRNGNTLITGPSGQGKSTLVKYIFLWLLFFGQKTLYIDPKNEMVKFMSQAVKDYGHMAEFVKLYESINFITLSTEEFSRGLLDPMVFLPKEEGIVEARMVLYLLGEVNKDKRTQKKYKAMIVAAINEVYASTDLQNNLGNVIRLIKEKDDDLGTTLEGFKDSIGKVLIAEDNSQKLDFGATVNVLGIQGLKMPTKEEKEFDGENINEEQIASEAIMDVIMHMVDVFSTNKEEDAAIVFDESKGFTETPRGHKLVDDGFRKGRANNTDIYALTQSHSDNDTDTMKDLISYKFAFKPNSRAQQQKVLNFFDMPDNQSNLDMLNGLKQGTCLFQDHMGRNQPIVIDVLFEEWLAGIKTTDTTDATTQRALELERINTY